MTTLNDPAVIAAIISAAAVVVAAIVGTSARQTSRFRKELSGINEAYAKFHKLLDEINDAVNNRHSKAGPEAKKAYDLLWETHKDVKKLLIWKEGFSEGDFATGFQAQQYVLSIDKKISDLHRRLDICKEECKRESN